MNTIMNIRAITLAVCAVSTTVFAQTVPVVVPSTAAEPPPAKHSCVKPVLPDAARKITAPEKNALVAGLEAFRTCIQAFAAGHEKIKVDRDKEVAALQDAAQTALTAAKVAAANLNTAVREYNEFSLQAVARINKDEPAPKSPGNTEAAPPRPSKNY